MSNIDIGIYGVLAVCAVIGLLFGLRKGLYKSLVDLGMFLIIATASIFISRWISKALISVEKINSILTFLSEKIPSMADTLTTLQETLTSVPEDVVSMVMVFPTVIITPILFILVYFLLGFILKLPKIIINSIIFGPNGGENYRGGSRLFGGLVGMIVKVASIAVFLIPVVGYINLANDSLTNLTQSSDAEVAAVEQSEEVPSTQMAETFDSLTETLSQLQTDVMSPLVNNFAVKSIYTCGGKWVFGSLTSVNIDSVDISLENELTVLTSMYDDIAVIMSVPVLYYGQDQITAIDNITDTVDNAIVIPSIISSAFSYSAQSWLDGEEVFGIGKVNVGEYYEPTLDKILTMLSETTADTVKADFHTIGNILNACVENQVFEDILTDGGIMSALERETFIADVFVELYRNEKTKELTTDLVNAFKNYIYKVYNDVNQTNIPYPKQLVIEEITEEMIYDEGVLIAQIIHDFNVFTASLDMEETDNTTFLINTDVRSLGKALDSIKKSMIFGDSYDFLVEAVLKSEGAYQFAFVTPEFIDAVINSKDTSMETILVSRQQIAILASSMKSEHKSEAIEHLLNNIDSNSAPVIKETLTTTVLKDFGMSQGEAETMSNALGSIVDQIAASESEMTEEELQKEVDAVDKIITTVQGASKNSSDGSIFAGEEDEEGITADKLVESVMNSQITSSAINSSSVDENGNTVEDPYKIANKITENDKESAKNAIENYYNSNAIPDADNEELKASLGSLANIFGVQVELGK